MKDISVILPGITVFWKPVFGGGLCWLLPSYCSKKIRTGQAGVIADQVYIGLR